MCNCRFSLPYQLKQNIEFSWRTIGDIQADFDASLFVSATLQTRFSAKLPWSSSSSFYLGTFNDGIYAWSSKGLSLSPLATLVEPAGRPLFLFNEPDGLPLFRGGPLEASGLISTPACLSPLLCESDLAPCLRGLPLPLFTLGPSATGWMRGLPSGFDSLRLRCKLNLWSLSDSSSGVSGIFLGLPSIFIFFGRPRFFTLVFVSLSDEKLVIFFDGLALCFLAVNFLLSDPRGLPLPLFPSGPSAMGWMRGLPSGFDSLRLRCKPNLWSLSDSSSGVSGIFLGLPGIFIFFGRPRFFTLVFITISGEK